MKEFERIKFTKLQENIIIYLADKNTEIFYSPVQKKTSQRKSYDGHFVFILSDKKKLVKRSINYTNHSFLRRCISLMKLSIYFFLISEAYTRYRRLWENNVAMCIEFVITNRTLL